MSGDIRGKLDSINFVDSPAVSMNNFHEYHDQMLEINKDEVMRVRDNSLSDGFDVSTSGKDADVAAMSVAFMEMSHHRIFSFPVACDFVVMNPAFPITEIVEIFSKCLETPCTVC